MAAFVLLIIVSCSSTPVNRTRTTEVIFKDGVLAANNWKGELKFKRLSWMQGIKLHYDMLYWQVDQNSPFIQWFSADEKEYLLKCFPLVVGVIYAGTPDEFSNPMMKMEMERNGFENVTLTGFGRHLKAHPNYRRWQLQQYRVQGFCRSKEKSMRGRYVYLDVPGYKQSYLEL
jgi:hypothetical protein